MKFTITYSTALVATLQLVSASNPFNKATNQLGGGAGLLEGRATGSVSSVERRVEEEDVNTYDADGCAVKECIMHQYEDGEENKCTVKCDNDDNCLPPEWWADGYPDQAFEGWCMAPLNTEEATGRRLFGDQLGDVKAPCPKGTCYREDFFSCAKHCKWYEDNRAEIDEWFRAEEEKIFSDQAKSCNLFSAFNSECGCGAEGDRYVTHFCDFPGFCMGDSGPTFCNNERSNDDTTTCQDFLFAAVYKENVYIGMSDADADAAWARRIFIGCSCPPESEDDIDGPQAWCDVPDCKQAHLDTMVEEVGMTVEEALYAIDNNHYQCKISSP